MPQCNRLSWIFGVSLVLFMTLTPFFYYRYQYSSHKRFRVVEEGKLYRCGSMTAAGFEEAIKRHGIKTVLNLQDEAQDPQLPLTPYSSATEKESELCARLGVDYRFLLVDLKPSNMQPYAIKSFLDMMRDPKNHPVLLHCRAGLHRTGVLVATYRMQENRWSAYEALGELRGLGFGRFNSYADNEYIRQYITEFRPTRMTTPAHLMSRQTNR